MPPSGMTAGMGNIVDTSGIAGTTIPLEPNTHAQRFMLLGSARTGSNFLLSMLSAHPRIKTYGELFNLDTLPQDSLLEALEDPIAFLQRRVYAPHGSEIRAVGFKMFYDHLTRHYFQKPIDVRVASPQLRAKFAQFSAFVESNYGWEVLDNRFRSTWEFLHADQSLAVIHLKRRNLLHTLISLKRAFITRQWWSLNNRPQATPPLCLDTEECFRYFRMLDNFAAETDTVFGSHAKIDVIYEDLAEKQEETLQRIFAFLRVSYEPVTTRMRKQNLASPRETVENYDELKHYFGNTKWDVFFE
jgi:LPS sulfotransferase NodH